MIAFFALQPVGFADFELGGPLDKYQPAALRSPPGGSVRFGPVKN